MGYVKKKEITINRATYTTKLALFIVSIFLFTFRFVLSSLKKNVFWCITIDFGSFFVVFFLFEYAGLSTRSLSYPRHVQRRHTHERDLTRGTPSIFAFICLKSHYLYCIDSMMFILYCVTMRVNHHSPSHLPLVLTQRKKNLKESCDLSLTVN